MGTLPVTTGNTPVLTERGAHGRVSGCPGVCAPYRNLTVSRYRPVRSLALLTACALLAACGGGKGSSQPPPTGIQVLPGDQSIMVSWTSLPNIQYWVYVGPPGTSPTNFLITGASPFPDVTTPFTYSGLLVNKVSVAPVNGRPYAVTINANAGGGAGGPSSAVYTVIPRAANTWLLGTMPASAVDGGADALYGAAYGVPHYVSSSSVLTDTGNPADFVYVGHNGSIWYTTQDANGQTFTPLPVVSGVATGSDLTAVAYNGGLGFLAVGTNGAASFSYDGITWASQTTGLSGNFRSIATTVGTGYIAVGDRCMVVATGSGGQGQTTVWTDYTAGFTLSSSYSSACTGSTPPSLHAAAYVGGGYVMAGGTQGTLAYSSDYGSTTTGEWLAATVTYPTGVNPATVEYNAITFGYVLETQSDGSTSSVPLWLAVGDYTDGSGVVRPLIAYTTAAPTTVNNVLTWTSWTTATLPSGLVGGLRAVNASSDPATGGLTQLVAVGDNGMILNDQLSNPVTASDGTVSAFVTSTPAQTWNQLSNPDTSAANLYALAHGNYGLQAGGTGSVRVFTY